MKVINRILGEAMTPEQRRIYKDPEKATMWAINRNQRFPEAEPYILKDPWWAHYYAKDVIKGRWPEAEKAIATEPWWAYVYAKDVIKGRWPECEEAVANSQYKDRYLHEFPEAKEDWAANGWIDWLDT